MPQQPNCFDCGIFVILFMQTRCGLDSRSFNVSFNICRQLVKVLYSATLLMLRLFYAVRFGISEEEACRMDCIFGQVRRLSDS